jgi:ElaB/YqjD/DUF883 family membrane-anchored ribosome-binding protein
MNTIKSNAEKMYNEVGKRSDELSNTVEHAIDSVHTAAQDTLHNMSSKVDSLQDQAKPAMDRLLKRGERLANSTIDGTRELSKRAGQAVSGYANACETYVVEQPMKAVAIAAAAGAAVAALIMLSRSRNNANRARFLGR